MQELLLVNPRARRAGHKKPRSAAQRAATKRMVAANKARRHSKRRAVSHRTAHYAHNPIGTAVAVHRRHRVARARSAVSSGVNMVKPVLQGAAGAIAVNAIANLLPLPATMKTGNMKYVVDAGVAIALGIVGKRFLGSAAGKMAEGSLIVTATKAISGIAGGMIPALAMHGLGDVPEYTNRASNYAPFGALTSGNNADVIPFAQQSGLGSIPEYL